MNGASIVFDYPLLRLIDACSLPQLHVNQETKMSTYQESAMKSEAYGSAWQASASGKPVLLTGDDGYQQMLAEAAFINAQERGQQMIAEANQFYAQRRGQ
jgi:hypothetical protein